MDEHVGTAKGATRTRRPRLIGRFPKIHIQTRAEMARTLQKWRGLFVTHAEAEFGPGALAEEAVRTTIIKLLAIEEPNFPHVLDAAMQVLRNQCHSIKLRLAREAADKERRKVADLYDPVLDMPITGAVAEAVERLPAAEQKAYLLAAQGVPPAMIAYVLRRQRKTVRQLLYRARVRIRADLEKSASAAAGTFTLLPVGDRARHPRHVVIQWAQHIAVVRRGAVARLADAIGRVTASPQASVGAALLLASAGGAPTADSLAPAAVSATAAVQPSQVTGPGPMQGASVTAALLPRIASQAMYDGPKLPRIIHVAIPGGGGAAAETPEDVRVTTAATPPRAPGAGPPAIVAVGMGQTCQCQVLMQSLDGGVTWSTPKDGPLIVLNQLVLPPAYPSDPRIFGSNGAADAGVPPYEAANFGAPFQPLALPAGRVAVSADFDAGDPRLFVANTTGVWSLDMAATTPPATPHLEIETAASTATTGGFVAALATPPATPDGPALLAWTPTTAVVPGAVTPPQLSPRLMVCPTSGLCGPRGDIPGLPQFLTVGADAPDTVVAYSWASNSLFVSRDGGRSFTTVGLPAPGDLAFSMAVVGTTGEVWGSFSRAARGEVDQLSDSGSWIAATRGDALVQSRVGTLFAVDSRRIIDALQGAGYRCTAIDGAAWTPRCPRPSTNAAG